MSLDERVGALTEGQVSGILTVLETWWRRGSVTQMYERGLRHDRKAVRYGTVRALPGLADIEPAFFTAAVKRMINSGEYTNVYGVSEILDTVSRVDQPLFLNILNRVKIGESWKGDGSSLSDSREISMWEAIKGKIAASFGLLAAIDPNLYMHWYKWGTSQFHPLIGESSPVFWATVKTIGSLANVDKGKFLELYLNGDDEPSPFPTQTVRYGLEGLAEVDPEKFVELYQRAIADKHGHDKHMALSSLYALAKKRPAEFLKLFEESLDDFIRLGGNNREGLEKNDSFRLFSAIAQVDPDRYLKMYNDAIGDVRSYYDSMIGLVSVSSVLADQRSDKFVELCVRGMAHDEPRVRAGTAAALHRLPPIDNETYLRLYRQGIAEEDTYDVARYTAGSIVGLVVADPAQFASLCSDELAASDLLVRHAAASVLGHMATIDPTRYLALYQKGILDEHDGEHYNVAVATAESLASLALTLKEQTLVKIDDDRNQCVAVLLRSKYADGSADEPCENEEDTTSKIARKIKEHFQRADVDYNRLRKVIEAGKAASIDEFVECSSISIPNYLPLKRLGSGAIKKAYLAVNDHSGDESAFLMIDPSSKGFEHYENIFRQQLEKQGVHMTDEKFQEWTLQKVHTTEFSGVRLRNLEDPRYIALVSPPIVGKDEKGNDVYFLETKPYDHTLEEELLDGPLEEGKIFKYAYQLALALFNCHKSGIVHKDLKPDNIGITKEGNVVLSDFGCVSMFSTAGDTRYQYPLALRPPELAHPDEYWQKQDIWWQSDLFTPEANVWTLGMILYRMATGKNLIVGPQVRAKAGTEEYHQQNDEVYRQIHDVAMIAEKLERMQYTSPACHFFKGIIENCLKQTPTRRIVALSDIIFSIKIGTTPGHLDAVEIERYYSKP